MNRKAAYLIISALTVLTLLLASCSQKPQGPVSNSSGGDWNVTIWESNPCVQPGDTVHLRASVINNRGTLEVIDSKDQPVLDIVISLSNSQVRWSDGKPLTRELTRLQLNPGESKTIEMDWVATNDIGYHGTAAVFHNPALRGYDVKPSVPLNIYYCGGP